MFDPDLIANWDRFVTHANTPPPEPAREPSSSPRFALPPPSRRPPRTRYEVREESRRALANKPLSLTFQGREIIHLSGLPWFWAPSGFAATRYQDNSSIWRANDVANYLHWASPSLLVHRSSLKRIVCVEDIAPLNALLVSQGYLPIVPQEPTFAWLRDVAEAGSERRFLPNFMRAGYSRARAFRPIRRRMPELDLAR